MPDLLRLPFSGTKLQERRERAGLTRPMLAERVIAVGHTVSPQHIARIEKGESRPSAPLLAALARALSVHIDALLDATGRAS